MERKNHNEIEAYLTRDKDTNELVLHIGEEPYLDSDTYPNGDETAEFWMSGGDWMSISEDLFPSVTFENSPKKVVIMLKEEIV